MELIRGKKLMQKRGADFTEVKANKALKRIEIIGFYFSAQWCPPCRGFTPILANFYRMIKASSEPFEVIFVSSDADNYLMYQFMLRYHGDWLAVEPNRDDNLREDLHEWFAIQGIPALVIVRRKNGHVITDEGRWDVVIQGTDAYRKWMDGTGRTRSLSRQQSRARRIRRKWFGCC